MAKTKKKNLPTPKSTINIATPEYSHFNLFQVDLEGKFKVKLYARNAEEAKLEVWNSLCRAFDNRIIAQNPEDGGIDITGTTGIEEGHEDYIRSVWY